MKNSTSSLKGYLAAFLTITVVSVCFAATYNTTGTGGNWASASTWSAGAIPPSGNHIVNINHNVNLTNSVTTLNGFNSISLNGGKTFTSGSTGTPNNLSLQNSNFTIVNGVMTVYGDLTLNSGANLVVTSGSLVVTGRLRLNGGTLTVANNQNVTVGQLEVTSSGGSSLTNNGNITVNGTFTQNGPVVNNSTGSVQVNGNHTFGGAWNSTFTNNGVYNLTGNMNIPSSSIFHTRPGGQSNVNGTVTVGSNQNLVIGTNVNAPPYAEMAIRTNLVSTGSGDILIDRNGRLAVFGNVTANGGGSFITINHGGQVYVDGNITMNGGGNHIDNNNTSAPWGLYTDGTVSYNGGGSNTQGHAEGTILDMYNESGPFFNWVSSLPGSPLPIELLYFKVSSITAEAVDLAWVTTFEKNFSHFQIERASVNLEFSVIEEITGRGGLEINALYEYKDTSPIPGKNYYRLKCVDIDGQYQYSPVIVAEINTTAGLSAYPNPVTSGSVSVKIGKILSEESKIELVDITGNVLFTRKVSGNVETMDIPAGIRPGLYYIRFISTANSETIKLIIR